SLVRHGRPERRPSTSSLTRSQAGRRLVVTHCENRKFAVDFLFGAGPTTRRPQTMVTSMPRISSCPTLSIIALAVAVGAATTFPSAASAAPERVLACAGPFAADSSHERLVKAF